jgi:hypothetical protein
MTQGSIRTPTVSAREVGSLFNKEPVDAIAGLIVR